MADPSFDVVSKVDRQEVDNALKQTAKELAQRFDFRGTGTTIDWSGEEAVTIQSETESRALAAVDVFREKLVKRGVSLKAFEAGEPSQSGKVYRIPGKILQGISQEKAKEIGKVIRDEKLKGVQARVQGDELRVTGKKKDDLQAVIALLKAKDFGIALQFVNYRSAPRPTSANASDHAAGTTPVQQTRGVSSERARLGRRSRCQWPT
jgi:uncharacterized protein YajQ (UPF0234 family)